MPHTDLYLKDLNAEQIDAITDDGSVFLIACPGSGKTRTLTSKIAHELSYNAGNKRYTIALTYTHRAADEIQDRVHALGVDTSKLWIGTIHSFCLEWIVRPYFIYNDDLKHGYRVIDTMERETILTDLCKQYRGSGVSVYDCDYYFNDTGRVISSSNASKHAVINSVLEEYFTIMRDKRLLDYEMILNYAYEIIKTNVHVSKILSKLFSIVLVDEYQDTRRLQYLIISSIVKSGRGETKLFMVGDPNQAIYQSLGGYAIDIDELKKLTNIKINEHELSVNYRSEKRIIEYFSEFNVHQTSITHFVKDDQIDTLVTFNFEVDNSLLEDEIVNILRYNIDTLGVPQHEICILAPWWVHLGKITRSLVARLPEYDFDGPGTVPFARDVDNFWYKVSRIALTSASPSMYTRRMRWAKDILKDLDAYGLLTKPITNKQLLFQSNSIQIEEEDGMTYLEIFFEKLFEYLSINIDTHDDLILQKDSFILSSTKRVEQLNKDGVDFSDIESFKRVYRERTGITVSTIHGIKGAEYDTVIAFSLLEGMVPHFADQNSQESAKRLIYVIASRARKNLHLISESGKPRGGGFGDYSPTRVLASYGFEYDTL